MIFFGVLAVVLIVMMVSYSSGFNNGYRLGSKKRLGAITSEEVLEEVRKWLSSRN